MSENPYEPPKGMEPEVSAVATEPELTSYLVDMGIGLLIVIALALPAAMVVGGR